MFSATAILIYREKAMKAMKQSAQAFSTHMDTDEQGHENIDNDDEEKGDLSKSDTNLNSTSEIANQVDPPPPCIICQLTNQQDEVLYLGFTQASRQIFHPLVPAILNTNAPDECDLQKVSFVSPKYGYISFCGHAMHRECFNKFIEVEYSRLNNFDRRQLIDRTANQYLCPLCKKLSNCIVPHMSCSVSTAPTQVVSGSSVMIPSGDDSGSSSGRNRTDDMMNFLKNDLFASIDSQSNVPSDHTGLHPNFLIK